ncbi:MAG: lytic transglycosylase domain-containing protein [Parvularculaceae bacterium]
MKMRVLIFLSMIGCAPASAAEAGDEGACDAAARRAEQKHRLPDGLLQAIARVETNFADAGEMKAWPWTVNIDGEGRWFKTRRVAEAFVAESRIRGSESIDIGCFQINAKWHGAAFENDAAMFGPNASADYAASFLKALKNEQGDWRSAVKTYHSRTPEKADRYAEKVMTAFTESGGDAEFNLLAAPAGAGGVALSLFQAGAPLLNAGGRKAIIDKTALSPLIPGEGDRAN